MNDTVKVALAAVFILLITLIHEIPFLLGAAVLIAVLSGRSYPRVAKRALVAMLLFNSVVTLSYLVVASLGDGISWHYVILVNTRVFALTSLTFLLVESVDPFRVVGFSRSLTYLLVLTWSQILTLRRTAGEFRHALLSRTPVRPSKRNLIRHGAGIGAYFISRTIHDADDIAQAMKSRGFPGDQR
jgi:cobalt/nickel transport system permease protein